MPPIYKKCTSYFLAKNTKKQNKTTKRRKNLVKITVYEIVFLKIFPKFFPHLCTNAV